MSLQNEFTATMAAWDGRHVEPLRELSVRRGGEPAFIPLLLDQYQNTSAWQIPITWLLKSRVEAGDSVSPSNWTAILAGAEHLTEWEARLHILQLIPALGLTARDAEQVESWVFRSLEAENTFERAAAYAAYHVVVQQFPGLKREFLAICREALDRERASVRVSIKRVLKAEGIRL